MPAHQETRLPSLALPTFQNIWSYLIREDFRLYPSEDDIDEEELPAKLLVIKPLVAMEQIPDFKHGLDRAFKLLDLLRAKNIAKSQIQSEWNYLGKNEERTAYLEYLETYFWQNQDNELLTNSAKYQSIVEDPWKLLGYLDWLPEPPGLPTDYFGDSTTRFIESLAGVMDKWDLNPYLLHTDLGSLQWRIQIDGLLALDGCIFAQESDLWLQIDMRDLTQII